MVEVVTISMDRTMKDLLDRHCSLNQCGRSETVRRAIMRYISPEEREAAPASEEETETPLAVLSPVESLEETIIADAPEPEPSMDAEAVSESVRRILEGKEA